MTETKPRYDFDPTILLDGVASGRYKIEYYVDEGVEWTLFEDNEIRRLKKLRQGVQSGSDTHFQPSQDGFFLDTLPRVLESDFARDRRLTSEHEEQKKSTHHHSVTIFDGIKHLLHLD